MAKSYNHKTFTFTVNGYTMSFYCETTDTRSGFCHHAYFWGLDRYGEHTRVSYYNRTWESFDYESTLRRAADKLPKAIRESLNLEFDVIVKNEHDKCAAFLKAFERNFNALSQEQKAFLKEHTPQIQNKQQADIVAGTVALLAAI